MAEVNESINEHHNKNEGQGRYNNLDKNEDSRFKTPLDEKEESRTPFCGLIQKSPISAGLQWSLGPLTS